MYFLIFFKLTQADFLQKRFCLGIKKSNLKPKAIRKNFDQLLNENHTRWHQTSDYAAELSVTPDHLNRVVKTLNGKNAKEVIQSRIVLTAKRLIYFSGLSTKEIGYKLGFSEPANFSAFFKKCTGVAPSQFIINGNVGQ